jgi:6,7-dimethyl-8-ribityllumazine synthase
VASRFHRDVTARLVAGARAVLRAGGAGPGGVRVVWVPGAFEIPQAALRVARRGGVDAVVCVGCVIRGETPHFEYVAGEAARGVGEAGRRSGVPTTFGVITADTREQALARAGGRVGNRGEEAARAALDLVALFARLDRARRPAAGRPRRPGR